jgi:Protein of unknown function (DUF2000)
MTTSESYTSLIALSDAFNDRPSVHRAAVGQLAQSLSHQAAFRRLSRYASYHDAAGATLGIFSWWPLVIWSASFKQVWKLWELSQDYNWPKACFVHSMIVGDAEAQVGAVAATQLKDEDVVGVGLFGPTLDLDAFISKLSLHAPMPDENLFPIRSVSARSDFPSSNLLR